MLIDFCKSQLRDDGSLDLACLKVGDIYIYIHIYISPTLLNFELGSALTRCGGEAEKIIGLQRKGDVLFLRIF